MPKMLKKVFVMIMKEVFFGENALIFRENGRIGDKKNEKEPHYA